MKSAPRLPTEDEYRAEIIRLASRREFFGCFDRSSGHLIAYSQNVVGEGVSYSLVKADPHYYRTHYPFYALFFTMTEHYLTVGGKKYVSDGFRSVEMHSNIQGFLIEKFKFRKAYVQLHVYYVWWLELIVRCLFPVRGWIQHPSISSLLLQEEISRESRLVGINRD